jgi:hypothetical protein
MGAWNGATYERANRYRLSVSGVVLWPTEIGVEMRYARGGGPSGTTNGLSGWRTEIGCRVDEKRGTACRLTPVITAVGPRIERRSASPGSAVLRHEQSDFDRVVGAVK